LLQCDMPVFAVLGSVIAVACGEFADLGRLVVRLYCTLNLQRYDYLLYALTHDQAQERQAYSSTILDAPDNSRTDPVPSYARHMFAFPSSAYVSYPAQGRG